jgi:hypothetical protein
VIINTKQVGTTGEAEIAVRIFADATRTKTFTQTGANQVVPVFTLANGKTFKPVYNIEDGSVTSVDVPFLFTLGAPLTWIGNRAWNSGGHKDSAAASVVIAAGGFGTAASAVTGLAVSSVTAIDEKHSYVSFAFTQPTVPVLLSRALILMQLAGEAAFSKGAKYPLLDEAAFLVAGAQSVTNIKVQHPKKTAIQYKIRLISVDETFIDSAVFNNTSPDLDTAAPNNGTAIPITRCVIKHGRTILTEIVKPTAQMASFWRLTGIIHDNGAIGGVRRYYDPATATWGTTVVEIVDSVLSVPISKAELFAGGRTSVYVKIGVWNQFNGGSVTYSADVPAVGGGQITAASAGVEPISGDASAALAMADGTLWSAYRPTLTWQSKSVMVSFDLPTVQVNTLRKGFAVIHNNSGIALKNDLSGCVNIVGMTDPQLHAAGVMFKVGKSGTATLPIKKKHLLNPSTVTKFLTTDGLFCTVKLYTDFTGADVTTATPASSNTSFDATGGTGIGAMADFIGNNEGVAVLDPRATLVSPANILKNSSFDFYDATAGSPNVVHRWQRWDGVTYPIKDTVLSIRENSASWRWDQNNHSVFLLAGTSQKLVYNLRRRLRPGERYAIGLFMRTSVAGGNVTINAQFRDGSVSGASASTLSDNTQALPTLRFINITDTLYHYGAMNIQVKNQPTFESTIGTVYNDQYLVIGLTNTTAGNILFNLITMVRGPQALMSALNDDEHEDAYQATVLGTPYGSSGAARLPANTILPTYQRFKDLEIGISAASGDYVPLGGTDGNEIVLP